MNTLTRWALPAVFAMAAVLFYGCGGNLPTTPDINDGSHNILNPGGVDINSGSNNGGNPDRNEGNTDGSQNPLTATDTDGDGILNEDDPDIDGDGIINSQDPDIDGDGIPNTSDTDMDGDGILNIHDNDIDGDGIININDNDIDGDGILNIEDADIDGDGIININDNDIDGDGIINIQDMDKDGDGILDINDPDIDGDGIVNTQDNDINGDGILNIEDPDIDGDGLLDTADLDIDGDGILNVVDVDLDGDGILNINDQAVDNDGFVNEIDLDIDNDGILNAADATRNGYVTVIDLGGPAGTYTHTESFVVTVGATTTITATEDVDFAQIRTDLEDDNVDIASAEIQNIIIRADSSSFAFIDTYADMEYVMRVSYQLPGGPSIQILHTQDFGSQGFPTQTLGGLKDGVFLNDAPNPPSLFVDAANWIVFSQLFKDPAISGATLIFEFILAGPVNPADQGDLNMEFTVESTSTANGG